MRAAFVGTSFRGGGAERHFARLVPGLLRGAESRIAVTLSPFERGDRPEEIECESLGFRSAADYPSAIRRLVRILDRRQVDLVYSISRCPNVVTIAASMVTRRRPVVVLGENTRPLEAFRLSPRLRDFGWLAFESACFRAADMVICNSRSACEEVVGHFGADAEKVRLARNPIPPGSLADRRLPGTEAELRVVTASRLVPDKGLEDLVDAWSRLRPASARLVILGEGPLRRGLQERARCGGVESTVEFRGWVEDPNPWLRDAAVVVLASYCEGLPNLVLEGMGAGAAVLATRSTSWITEFENAGAVAAVEPGDVKALASALQSLLTSESYRRELSERGMRVASAFNVDGVIAERNTLLLEACQKGESTRS
ncbi:MAG TPA: glycosyltransferase [Thermoanaerobaculia bacterium]|nr:glycosyltransferase [Thermoanaerobaculia bacterium]